jgi:hypothetical protein
MTTPYSSAGEVLKAVLAHLSTASGGEGITLQVAVLFLDEHAELEALDAVMNFSADDFASSTWCGFRQLGRELRASILDRVRADLASAPAASFIPHEDIPVLVTRAA